MPSFTGIPPYKNLYSDLLPSGRKIYILKEK
jgi:hypothetical protein